MKLLCSWLGSPVLLAGWFDGWVFVIVGTKRQLTNPLYPGTAVTLKPPARRRPAAWEQTHTELWERRLKRNKIVWRGLRYAVIIVQLYSLTFLCCLFFFASLFFFFGALDERKYINDKGIFTSVFTKCLPKREASSYRRYTIAEIHSISFRMS